MRTGNLHWFQVRQENNDYVKCVKHFEVDGRVPVGISKMAWDEVLKDMESKKLSEESAQ